MNTRIRSFAPMALILAGAFLFSPPPAFAHCDGLDGPVVEDGRDALATGELGPALIWVLEEDEEEVRSAFEHTLEVRKLGDEARELADRHFLETLVRLHRQGEGAEYTGLKPAGRDLGPAIPAADDALETGSLEELEGLLVDALRHGLRHRFHEAEEARDFARGDVDAGRAYVEAYVDYLHFVEAIHEVAEGHGLDH